jgi:hypothetical protein
VHPILRCEAVRWVSDEPFPGWIEVTFTDVDGHLWSVFDKQPIFCRSLLDLDRNSRFPVAVELACKILAVEGDVVTISTLTPWGVSTEDGRSEFTVFAWQLIEPEAPSGSL